MSKRHATSRTAWVRRGVQLAFLLLFCGLLIFARPVAGQTPSDWHALFFYLDPLILLLTAIAAWAVPLLLLAALGTVVVTIVFGRVFCGWVCPLGTVHAIAGRIFDYWRPRRRRNDHWSRWQLSKYFILVALIVLAVFGVQWLTLFDPIAILYRTTTTALWPAFQWGVEDSTTAVYQWDPAVGGWHLTKVTEPAYKFLRDRTFVVSQQAFVGTTLILGFFAVIVALNFFRRRFWCRYICPLGGLLGLLAWRPWLTRKTDAEKCNQCDLCGMTCHGAASSAAGTGWKPQECFGCLNCTDACVQKGLHFTLQAPWQRRSGQETVDLTRRGLLGAAGSGLAALLFFKITPAARGRTYNPALVRPPGARPEDDFLARCIACGACMKICPTGGLQPAVTEAGLAGLWTPVLDFHLGYCEYECNRCGEVCPTEAITPLLLDVKKKTKLGLASFDVTRCLPYAYNRDCMVCEEHCPVPDKAIYFLPVEVTLRDGSTATVNRPHVDPDKCIGCGNCEHVCPFKDRPAIRVTSANETRHPKNQPMLPGFNANSPYGF